MNKKILILEQALAEHHPLAKKVLVDIALARPLDTVGQVLMSIEKSIHHLHLIDYVYVLKAQQRLVGVVSFKNLLRSSKKVKIEKIMQKKVITAFPDMDQEKIADLAVKHNLKAVPLVEGKKLLGVLPIEHILPILNKALREDILHLAGIHKAHLNYENTLAVPLLLSVIHRLPYLLVGLVGIILAALFIHLFEETLQTYVILAFFIPAILYMSNALGTQHQTLFIRDLAILGKELNLKKYFIKQLAIGFFIALVLSGVMFLVISLLWKEPFIAFVISMSLFATLVVTSFTSFLVTLTITKLHFDPALGSGPLATIISDVTSIIVYFVIATLLLGL